MKITRILPKQKGFTLLEVLVVVTLFGVIGYIMAGTLERSINGGTKTALIGDVKQVGQSALDNMSPQIHNADEIICTTPGVPTYPPVKTTGIIIALKAKVHFQNSGSYFTRFYFDTSNNPNDKTNQEIVQDFPLYNPSLGDLAQLCDTSKYPITDPPLPNPPPSLTDNKQALLVVNNPPTTDPLFTYTPGTGGVKDTVTISFSLKPALVSTNFADTLGNNNSIPFSTTVEVR